MVVRDGKVVGLHCSGPELHAGQAAIIQHGGALAGCQLYFSRRPCATCLKMIINGEKRAKKKKKRGFKGIKKQLMSSAAALRSSVGVSLISFWPGDPEVSVLRSANSRSRPDDDDDFVTEEARLDAMATEILKSNGRPHICVPLQPLLPGLAQFIYETSRDCDFMETLVSEQPGLDTEELYNR